MSYHRRRVSLHRRIARAALAVALLLLCAAVIAAIVNTARAHGEAGWIMNEPSYRDADNIHCCGPTDCAVMPDDAVEVTAGGYRIKATGELFEWTAKGVYTSPDDKFWSCFRGGATRCLFVPGRMG